MNLQELKSEINTIATEVVYELSAKRNAGFKISAQDLINCIKSNVEFYSELTYNSILFPIQVAVKAKDIDLYKSIYPRKNG